MKAERFEDLIVWQKARKLTAQVYETTAIGEFARDYGLRDQMRRSAVSIMANVSEGFERFRPNEFHQFLSVAKASCGELRSHLYVALDANYIGKISFQELMDSANELARLVSALRTSIENKKNNCSEH